MGKIEFLILFILKSAPLIDCATYGYFYSYPTRVLNHGDRNPELVKSKFYLSQVNMTTAALQGTLEVLADSIGPLSVRASMQPWTDTGFKETSAGSAILRGCTPGSALTQILEAFSPAHHLNMSLCMMYKGTMKLSRVFLDTILHKSRNKNVYGRTLFVVDFIDDKERDLFGFTIDLVTEDRMIYFYKNNLVKEYQQEVAERNRATAVGGP